MIKENLSAFYQGAIKFTIVCAEFPEWSVGRSVYRDTESYQFPMGNNENWNPYDDICSLRGTTLAIITYSLTQMRWLQGLTYRSYLISFDMN